MTKLVVELALIGIAFSIFLVLLSIWKHRRVAISTPQAPVWHDTHQAFVRARRPSPKELKLVVKNEPVSELISPVKPLENGAIAWASQFGSSRAEWIHTRQYAPDGKIPVGDVHSLPFLDESLLPGGKGFEPTQPMSMVA